MSQWRLWYSIALMFVKTAVTWNQTSISCHSFVCPPVSQMKFLSSFPGRHYWKDNLLNDFSRFNKLIHTCFALKFAASQTFFFKQLHRLWDCLTLTKLKKKNIKIRRLTCGWVEGSFMALYPSGVKWWSPWLIPPLCWENKNT